MEMFAPVSDLARGLAEALALILGGDPALWEVVGLSMTVSGVALLVSALTGVPAGAALALGRFPGRRLLIAFTYTGMGFPPVVIGLAVYLLLSRSGPLAGLEAAFIPRLFTPGAMILAQLIIAFPLVAGFTMAAVLGVDPALRLQVRALGATQWQTTLATLVEARLGVLVAIVAGFGGIISEVGAVMIVGGNIEGRTRVLTTAIVLETQKGAFGLAMALGILLLTLSFVANFVMLRLQGRSLDV
jgi:tungstate transport system permease protein